MPPNPTVTSLFARENATYNTRKAELLKMARGKIIVIQGDRLLGPFDTDHQAYDQAYRTFGLSPFLVRPIQEEEEVIYLSGSALGW